MQPSSGRRPNVGIFKRICLLASAVLLGCGGEVLPVGAPPGTPSGFVAADSARIMDDLRTLAHDTLEGRRTGEPGNRLARDYIRAGFRRAGLRPPPAGYLQPFPLPERSSGDGDSATGANVVGWVPGSDPSLGAIVLTAHFDHLGVRDGRIYNGADDNASGVAALLSLARYVARHPLRHTAVFAALDGEEMGLLGARAFLTSGWPRNPVLNLNMDMVSRSDSLLVVAGTHHYPRLRTFLDDVEGSPPVVLEFGYDEPGVEGRPDWTRSSDHGVFHERGIPFLYFGVEDHEDYHRPTDDFEKIDRAFFIGAVRTVLAATLTLDEELAAHR
jgi:hypothetical protein